LYGAFPVKRLLWVLLTVLCSERERPFFIPSPAIQFPERAEGVNKLRSAGYVVKCDHPSVTSGAWLAEALAITEAGRTALAKHRAEIAGKKGRHRPGDQAVIFRRDRDRYIVFLGDDRIGFVRRADNGTWNHVDTTMAHSGYAQTRERAGQLLRRRYERMVRDGEI
jgi:hypothetical protein